MLELPTANLIKDVQNLIAIMDIFEATKFWCLLQLQLLHKILDDLQNRSFLH